MFRKMIAAAIALATIAGSADARAPWESKQPRGMQQAHSQMAQQANDFFKRNGPGSLGFDPLDFNWSYNKGVGLKEPMSNMTPANLNRLTKGKYVILPANVQKPNGFWEISYFAPNGQSYICSLKSKKKAEERVLPRYITSPSFGAGGILHWDAEKNGRAKPGKQDTAWPTVYNPSTGQLTSYTYKRNKWIASHGWVQSEYPAIAQEFCPNLPRKAKVNNAQSGLTISEIAKGAKAISGIPVAFHNDNKAPLTAGMYYWAYPPVQ